MRLSSDTCSHVVSMPRLAVVAYISGTVSSIPASASGSILLLGEGKSIFYSRIENMDELDCVSGAPR